MSDRTKETNDPKNHHYIPVFYLKKWRINVDKNNKLNGQLLEYSKPYKDVFYRWKYPTATGFETNLYTHKKFCDIDKYIIETETMGDIDNKTSNIIVDLINGSIPKRQSSNRRIWAAFMANIAHRVPERFSGIKKIFDFADEEVNKVLRDCYYSVRSEEDPGTATEFIDQYDRDRFSIDFIKYISNIWSNKDFVNNICNMKWSVKSTNKFPFLTSDRPLVGRIHSTSTTKTSPKKLSYICFALSPEKIFVAATSNAALKSLATERGGLSRMYNNEVVKQCKNYVYSRDLHQDAFIKNNFGKGRYGNLGVPDEDVFENILKETKKHLSSITKDYQEELRKSAGTS